MRQCISVIFLAGLFSVAQLEDVQQEFEKSLEDTRSSLANERNNWHRLRRELSALPKIPPESVKSPQETQQYEHYHDTVYRLKMAEAEISYLQSVERSLLRAIGKLKPTLDMEQTQLQRMEDNLNDLAKDYESKQSELQENPDVYSDSTTSLQPQPRQDERNFAPPYSPPNMAVEQMCSVPCRQSNGLMGACLVACAQPPKNPPWQDEPKIGAPNSPPNRGDEQMCLVPCRQKNGRIFRCEMPCPKNSSELAMDNEFSSNDQKAPVNKEYTEYERRKHELELQRLEEEVKLLQQRRSKLMDQAGTSEQPKGSGHTITNNNISTNVNWTNNSQTNKTEVHNHQQEPPPSQQVQLSIGSHASEKLTEETASSKNKRQKKRDGADDDCLFPLFTLGHQKRGPRYGRDPLAPWIGLIRSGINEFLG